MPWKGGILETTEATGIAAPPARPELARLGQIYHEMRAEAARVVLGQEDAFQQMLVALFTGGHVLLEGVPGTAKTLMAKTLPLLVSAGFGRVQFTPDLMPSDITGTNVFDLTSSTFTLRRGPVFTNILLA